MSSKDLIVVYRTSDMGRLKSKIYSDRWSFLDNIFEHFGTVDIVCIADNVSDLSLERLEKYPFKKVVRTYLSNSKSFFFSYELLLSAYGHYKWAYFLEDDYLHRGDSLKVLLEGLEIADYVTLYDHPDKYYHGVNPRVTKIGAERSYVFLTRSSHWKTTNSTTMSFAARLRVLVKDRKYFELFTVGSKYGEFIYPRWFVDKGLPRDYRLWWSLRFFKGRILISSMHGLSTHGETDNLSPFWK